MGRRLCDRYHVHSVIGTGGMGAVCRATDERLGRDVAVKVLTLAPADSDELDVLRKRFHREARAAAALRHPNVVTVHDFGTDPEMGLDFLVMEYLPGEDVADRIAREGGALPVPEALEIWREAAMGVAAGHRVGLVHRDLKPRNLFLVQDPAGGWEVKVLDFGIAQISSGSETLAQLTRALAPHTPRYAAPEQFRGDQLGPACDVYSLSLTALEMLCGRYPQGVNQAEDDTAASRWVSELNAARPDLPASVAAVLLKSLLRDPSRRFADAGRLLSALDRAMTKTGQLSGLTSAGLGGPKRGDGEELTVAMPAARPSGPADAPRVAEPQPAMPPRPRFSIPVPPPVVAQPAGAPASPGAEPTPSPDGAEATEDKGEGKKRRRPGFAALLLVLLLVAALGAALMIALDPGPGGTAPGETKEEQEVAAATDPVRMLIVATEEAKRIESAGGSVDPGDTLWIVVAASLPESQTGEAMRLRDRLGGQGYPAGVGNSRVYPELMDGYAVVLTGPYRSRDEATEARGRVRETFASDAFLKRVTFRPPGTVRE
jgi:serine/threonine protein kinase